MGGWRDLEGNWGLKGDGMKFEGKALLCIDKILLKYHGDLESYLPKLRPNVR